jgi:hypothetical protein
VGFVGEMRLEQPVFDEEDVGARRAGEDIWRADLNPGRATIRKFNVENCAGDLADPGYGFGGGIVRWKSPLCRTPSVRL